MRQSLWIGLFIAIALGCSTTNKSTLPPPSDLLPPEMSNWPINNQLLANRDFLSLDLFLSRVARENPAPNTYWWADYRRAQLWTKKDTNVACENFSKLAIEHTFPLRRLAYLRAHQACPNDNQILARLEPFSLDNFSGDMKNLALEVALAKARASNDREALISLLLAKSKLNLRREEKVSLTLNALNITKKMGDKEQNDEIEKRLYMLSPSYNPKPSPDELLSVAADFRYRRKFENARQIYRRILGSKHTSFNDRLQAYRGIRSNLKLEQKRLEAVEATDQLGQFVLQTFRNSKKKPVDIRLYQETELLLIRSLWTEGLIQRAEKIMSRVEKNLKNLTSLAELYWIRGRMYEEKQDFLQATNWLKKSLKEPAEDESFKEKILWYLAWNERKLRHFDAAAEIFKTLRDKAENPYEKNKYHFWLAKTLADQEKSKDAKDEFDELKKTDPLSYYGLLAHREVNESLPLDKFRKTQKEKEADHRLLSRRLRQRVDQTYLEWLIAVREDDVAKDYLDQAADHLLTEFPEDAESWMQLMRQYGRTHNYLAMFSQLNRLPLPQRRALFEDHPELIFPSPYSETVSRSASRFGISVEFIYSVMRQESSFNPQARSHMDAYGLMQLLPEVAKRSAESNSLEYSSPDDLYEPHINIPLGSAHLRELWDRYNGEFVLAVASYNASETAILNWLKTRFRGDSLEFIEDIPYDETRDYVKLVLRNLINYQMLHAQVEQLDFPEWTLKISQKATKP